MAKSANLTLHDVGLSDVGRRRQLNEDSWGRDLPADPADPKGAIFAVADGVGGHAAGELASSRAVELLLREYRAAPTSDVNEALSRAFAAANEVVIAEGEDDASEQDSHRRRASTLVVGVIADNQLVVAHIGDSRAYLIRDHAIHQLTQDHTLAQEWVRQGLLSAEDAVRTPQNNVITRAIGRSFDKGYEVAEPIPLSPNDVLLLCSDGLTKHVDPPEIAAITSMGSPSVAARRLIDLANERGGTDNVTVIVVGVGGPDEDTLPGRRQGPPVSPTEATDQRPAVLVDAQSEVGDPVLPPPSPTDSTERIRAVSDPALALKPTDSPDGSPPAPQATSITELPTASVPLQARGIAEAATKSVPLPAPGVSEAATASVPLPAPGVSDAATASVPVPATGIAEAATASTPVPVSIISEAPTTKTPHPTSLRTVTTQTASPRGGTEPIRPVGSRTGRMPMVLIVAAIGLFILALVLAGAGVLLLMRRSAEATQGAPIPALATVAPVSPNATAPPPAGRPTTTVEAAEPSEDATITPRPAVTATARPPSNIVPPTGAGGNPAPPQAAPTVTAIPGALATIPASPSPTGSSLVTGTPRASSGLPAPLPSQIAGAFGNTGRN